MNLKMFYMDHQGPHEPQLKNHQLSCRYTEILKASALVDCMQMLMSKIPFTNLCMMSSIYSVQTGVNVAFLRDMLCII